jgi:hypothetical protein
MTGERPPQAPPQEEEPEPEATVEVRGSSTSPRTLPSVDDRNPCVWPIMRGTGGQSHTPGAAPSPDYEFSARRPSGSGSPEPSTDPLPVSRGLITISPQFAGFFVLGDPLAYLAVHPSEPPELGGNDRYPETADGPACSCDPPPHHRVTGEHGTTYGCGSSSCSTWPSSPPSPVASKRNPEIVTAMNVPGISVRTNSPS